MFRSKRVRSRLLMVVGICSIAVVALVSAPSIGPATYPQTQNTPAVSRAQEPSVPSDELFLSDADIPRVQRILPGLVEATHKGRDETRAFLATQEVDFRKLTQLLSNISIAYSAIKFEEQMKELEPKLQQQTGEYQGLLAQSRRQFQDISAKYRAAQKGGRSALDANREIVAKNRPQIEEIVLWIRDINVISLPTR